MRCCCNNLGGSPDEGIHRSPLETVLVGWGLRPSPFSEYRQIVSGTLKVWPRPRTIYGAARRAGKSGDCP